VYGREGREDCADQLVADGVAKNIIRDFQHIDICVDDGQRQVFRYIDSVPVFLKMPSVEQSSKRVMEILLPDFVLSFLELADVQKAHLLCFPFSI